MSNLDEMGSFGNACCNPSNKTHSDRTFDGDGARLAQEMHSLSVTERESIYDEIHGCGGIVEETPSMLAKCLEEMRSAIDQIPQQNRKAYNRAVFLRPSLESDDRCHLMFLRAQKFNSTDAAYHLCRSFEHKLKLFGEEKLVKSITLDDLGETERVTHMYSGAIQMLPSADSTGRGVLLVSAPSLRLDEDWYSLARYTWYQIYSAAEGNEEFQRRGVVQVTSIFGEWKSSLQEVLEYVMFSSEFAGDWPIRLCGHHYCYDQVAFHHACVTLLAFRGKNFRLRNRTHFGSKIEIQYNLMTFGINLQDCLDPGRGVLSKDRIANYLDERRLKEAATQQQESAWLACRPGAVLYPTSKDVLMGRGRPFITWPGNVRLPQRVSPYLDQYVDMKDIFSGKAAIVLEVLDEIQLEGGRFLKRNSGYWEIADDQKAKEKVSQIFRAEIRNRHKAEDLTDSSATDVIDHTSSTKRLRLSGVPQ